jgi:hypothetical protein
MGEHMKRTKGVRKVLYLQEDEEVVIVKKSSMYRLGHPLEDIITGETIVDALRVEWCMLEQRWRE